MTMADQMENTVRLDDDTFLIVGGGIGGLATALSLSQIGRKVHLIERAPAYSEVGAGLQIGPNGSRALDRLGVLPRLYETAIFPERISLNDIRTGERVTHLELGAEFVERFGYRYMVMHRSDLLNALLEACRASDDITMENDRHVTGVEIGESEAHVQCGNRTRYVARALVGADGNMSVVRRAIHGDLEPKGDGYVVYRGTVPFQNMIEDAKGNAIVLYMGPGIHLIQYPIRGGELYNQAATFLSRRYLAGEEEWGTSEELDAAFEGCAPIVRQSLSCVDRSIRWPLRDIESFAPWNRGPAVLIGDAAHAMYQYVAQGACQSLEDAIALADCVAGAGTAEEAFAAFSDARLLRTARVQLTARNFGDVLHMDGIGAGVRDAIMKARDPKDYDVVDWLWGEGQTARKSPQPASTRDMMEQTQ